MARLICITGTPGAGKSTLALALCSLFSWNHIDIHDLEKECGEFNPDKDCYDLDMAKVEAKVKAIVSEKSRLLEPKGSGGVKDSVFVFDTHVSHLLDSSLVDLCVVVRCSDFVKLKERLLARDYSEEKVAENLECEIMDVCFDEAQENLGEKGVVIIEVNGSGKGYSLDVLESVKKLV